MIMVPKAENSLLPIFDHLFKRTAFLLLASHSLFFFTVMLVRLMVVQLFFSLLNQFAHLHHCLLHLPTKSGVVELVANRLKQHSIQFFSTLALHLA